MAQEQAIEELTNVFLALSDKTRLRLVAALAAGEGSVNYLAKQVSESQPKVSRHLAYLRTMNVVTTRRDGKHVYYSLETRPDAAAAAVLLAAVRALGEPQPASRARTSLRDESKHVREPIEELAIHLL